MKKRTLLLLCLMMIASLLLGACASTPPAASPSPSPTGGVTITGAGLELSFSLDELRAMEQVPLSTSNVSSSGEVTQVNGTAVSLTKLLKSKGVEQKDLAAVTFIAADAYTMAVPKDIMDARELFILMAVDGKNLDTPRSAIPDERAMYWVRDLVKIELSTGATPIVKANKVVFFRVAAKKMQTQSLNNHGEPAASYAMKALCTEFLAKTPTLPVAMRASDGLIKDEKAAIFLDTFVTLEGEDAPLYFSETLADGMRVKKLDVAFVEGTAFYFGQKTMKVSELLTLCAFDPSESYTVTGEDGFALTITAAEMKKGTVTYENGTFNASFPGVKTAGGTVKNVVSLAATK